jgi:hypothetical protein
MAPVLAATKANIRFTWEVRSGPGQSQPDMAANQPNRGNVLAPQELSHAWRY